MNTFSKKMLFQFSIFELVVIVLLTVCATLTGVTFGLDIWTKETSSPHVENPHNSKEGSLVLMQFLEPQPPEVITPDLSQPEIDTSEVSIFIREIKKIGDAVLSNQETRPVMELLIDTESVGEDGTEKEQFLYRVIVLVQQKKALGPESSPPKEETPEKRPEIFLATR